MKKKNRLQILVSNDDGIDSTGIYALVREMKKLGDVTVVAPHKQQSAVGHAITMNYPLRVSKYNKNGKFFGYAVEGTPADCVKLAVRSLLPSPPDLLVSGINHGSNTAINIIYSGTVSAATEGTVLGIPSIAMSLTSYKSQEFHYAARFARKLSALVLKNGLPKGTLLNVNVPAVPENQIKGIKITRQGKTNWNDTFDTRLDPYKNTYYWLTGELEIVDHSDDTDQIAVMKKCVSITPIHYDLTEYSVLENLRSWGVEKLR